MGVGKPGALGDRLALGGGGRSGERRGAGIFALRCASPRVGACPRGSVLACAFVCRLTPVWSVVS